MCKNDGHGDADANKHTTQHIWMFEPPTADNNTKALTDSGVALIAAHKYKSGTYTYLDNLGQPFWNALTEMLPMSLAPNMVTLMGFSHCLASYLLIWYYSPNFDTNLPDWVVFVSGYCGLAYYTFDCMDGKQARRTGQGSPLGQLFDHGFDCLANLYHISTIAGYLQIGGTQWFLGLQASLFFSFFIAQWEEYYTGTLPHAMGNFGVTEMNYLMGSFAIWNSMIDREKFWTNLLGNALPASISALLPSAIVELQVREFSLAIWLLVNVGLIVGAFYQTLLHEFTTSNNLVFSALTKLITPFLVAAAPLLLPAHILASETRYISLCLGLLSCFLCIKMICFSMARQSFASIQVEAIPYLAVMLSMAFDNAEIFDETTTRYTMIGLCVWYLYRLLNWASLAIGQICERLDIYCLTIKHPKHKNPKFFVKQA